MNERDIYNEQAYIWTKGRNMYEIDGRKTE